MPTHPPDPNEFQTWANDMSARLRAVERRLQRIPENQLLQTYENGDPLGDTLHLDFMEGLNAVLVGDKYVEVTCDCAGVGTTVAVAEQSTNKIGDNNDTITVTFAIDGPAIVAGHLLIAHVVCGESQVGTFDITTPAGGTKVVQNDTGGTVGVQAFFYRIADGTETNVAFSVTSSGAPPDGLEGFAVKIFRLVGFDAAAPINASSQTAVSGALGAGDSYIVDGVTTTVTNCLVIYGTGNRLAGGTTISWIGIGELYDFTTAASSQASISAASKSHPDAGPSGSILTIVNSGGNTYGICMAIAPGTGGL